MNLQTAGPTDPHTIGADITLNGGPLVMAAGSNITFTGVVIAGASYFGAYNIETSVGATVGIGAGFAFAGQYILSGFGSKIRFDAPDTYGFKIVLQGGVSTFDVGANDVTLNRFAILLFASLIKVGTGTLTLTGTEQAQFGSLGTISAGTLAGTTALLPLGNITDNGTLAFTDTGAGSYDSVISGTGAVKMTGSGTLTLSATNTYTGATTVEAGTVLVNGSIASSSTTVASGATLGGAGTTGAVTVQAGGTLAPGNSAGILHTGNLDIAGAYNAEINGATVGTLYDQAQVNGSVALSGTLNVALGYTPTVGAQYVVINNNGTADAVTGTFTGLTEGAIFTSGSQRFQISYHGGDGNDVVLTALAALVPPSSDPSTTPTGSFIRTQTTSDAGGTLSGTYGNDTFVGGAGRDTVLLQTVKVADAKIEQQADGAFKITSALGTDTLKSVERIAFADGTLQLDLGGARALQVESLYHAAFGRAPDMAGLTVQLDSGMSLATMARAFTSTAEFRFFYEGISDIDFVVALYQNALGRRGDYAGILVQLDALAHGLSRADLLVNFATAAEAVQVVGNLHPAGGIFTNDHIVA